MASRTRDVGTTLAIIERSHRGTVEQQYAHVLWLAHGLHRQSAMTILLRGGAAVYALAGPLSGPVEIGGVPWGEFPDYPQALARLHADGATVLVAQSSLTAFGVAGRPLLPGVEAVGEDRIAAVVAACDRVWFL